MAVANCSGSGSRLQLPLRLQFRLRLRLGLGLRLRLRLRLPAAGSQLPLGMVYVRLVAEEEPDARVVAEASLRMSGWSPEKVHQKRKGKRALRRAVTTLTKQRKAAEQRAELQRARPNISADMALAEEHREVRRCTRRVEHQLRGAGVTVSMRKLHDSTLKLSAAMEKDRPPHAMYATHRAWLSQ